MTPKLIFKYVLKNGATIEFDFLSLFETVLAAAKAFDKMKTDLPGKQEYVVTYCEDAKDIPEYAKQFDPNKDKLVPTDDGVEVREDLHIG